MPYLRSVVTMLADYHVRALAEQDARAGGHHDGFRREEEREGVERLGAGPWRVAHTDPQHGSTHLTNT